MTCDNIHVAPLLGALLSRVPVRVWTVRNMESWYAEMRHPTLRERLAVASRASCFIATRVIAVSNAVKMELLGIGIPEPKIWVRPNPRRVVALTNTIDRREARQQYGFDDSEVVVVALGHAIPVKGWDLLIKAFGHVARCNSRARLVLAGSFDAEPERPFYAELKHLVEANQLSDKVHFTGHLLDIAPLLKGADLFVMPSRSEGCANALLEALQFGLPVVAAKVGNAAEVIQHNVTGLLVERGRDHELADALMCLVQDEGKRKDFASRATLPASILPPEEYAERLARDYESLVVCR
jgi:glycosyltransferase involved in cell wall biosynthesis